MALIPWLSEQLSEHDVRFWTDHALKRMPGENYKRRIRDEIRRADFAMLLISQSFTGSKFIREYELPWIKEEYDRGRISIIPLVISKPSRLGLRRIQWIYELQMLPSEVHPMVTLLDNQALFEEAQVEVVDAIDSRLQELAHAGRLGPRVFVTDDLRRALGELRPAVPSLVPVVSDPSLLAGMVDDLVSLTEAAEPYLRHWLYVVLGSIDGERPRRALERGLQDQDEYARSGAAYAMEMVARRNDARS